MESQKLDDSSKRTFRYDKSADINELSDDVDFGGRP